MLALVRSHSSCLHAFQNCNLFPYLLTRVEENIKGKFIEIKFNHLWIIAKHFPDNNYDNVVVNRFRATDTSSGSRHF